MGYHFKTLLIFFSLSSITWYWRNCYKSSVAGRLMEVRRVVKAERAMSGSAVVFWCLLFTDLD